MNGPNALKLSDSGGMAQPVLPTPPPFLPPAQAVTARSCSLERMVRPIWTDFRT